MEAAVGEQAAGLSPSRPPDLAYRWYRYQSIPPLKMAEQLELLAGSGSTEEARAAAGGEMQKQQGQRGRGSSRLPL